MNKYMIEEKHPLHEHKSYLLLFTLEGHRTWRKIEGQTIEKIENNLKINLPKNNKITAKKFFEIDHNLGTFEEF